MQLTNASWYLSRWLALALLLLSGDALGQGTNAQWQAPVQARSVALLVAALDVGEDVASVGNSLEGVAQPGWQPLDRRRLELFLGAQDREEARRAEDMLSGYPLRVSYGVLTEGRGGRRFVVAIFFHREVCGASSCAIYFLMQRSGRWRFAGDASGVDVSFAGQSAHGFPVFIIHDLGDRCPYRWNGTRFWWSSTCRDDF
jgi:hypothetical protein